MKANKEVLELFVLVTLVISCHAYTMTKQTQFPVFDKEGHRGCRGLMPENTIPAMLKALDLGVTTLEMDAHITRDSQVIISHDPYYNPELTTLPVGSILKPGEEKKLVLFNMTYQETMAIDVGLKPYPRFPQQAKLACHKPLLADLIDSCEQYCKRQKRPLPFYNIETKSLPATDNLYHPKPSVFVDLIMKVVQEKGVGQRVIIQSFDIRTLQAVREKYPMIRTALLVEGTDLRGPDQQIRSLGFTPYIYSPEQTLVNQLLVQDCHKFHMRLVPWTVDNKQDIIRLTNLGVDGIITDYPNLF